MEKKDMFALMQRAKIYTDYLHIIQPLASLRLAKFIYIVKPKNEEEDNNEVLEVLNEMKNVHETTHTAVKKQNLLLEEMREESKLRHD